MISDIVIHPVFLVDYSLCMNSNDISVSDLQYDETSADFVTVDAVPERRGVVIKHVEYAVSCKKFSAQVHRRYKDFLTFRELLLLRFSYRIIPKLPPKKINIIIDLDLVEERRKCLQRFLNFILRHPAMGSDVLVKHFLTVEERDIYLTMKSHFSTLPDEFFVHPGSLKALSLLSEHTTRDYKRHRENIQQILVIISGLHDLLSARTKRFEAEAADFKQIESWLKELTGVPLAVPSPTTETSREVSTENKYLLSGVPKWLTNGEREMIETARSDVCKTGPHFAALAKSTSDKIRSEEDSVLDKLGLLIDVITGYQELCQRHEKGVTTEHHRAIRQLNNLRKLTSGSSPGLANSPQNLEAIEQTVHQQEAEIATIEQRNAFALYCVQEETRLVYCYLALIHNIIGAFASVNSGYLGELSPLWREIGGGTNSSLKNDYNSPTKWQPNGISARKP